MTENELIDYWSKNLTERLVEIRFIDIDDMKAAIRVHVKSALSACLKVQLSETKRKLDEVKDHYVNYGGGRNNHIQAEIISLKQKLKEENKLLSFLDNENKTRELVLWMRKNHEQSLLDFYKHYDQVWESDEPIKTKEFL